MAHCPVLGNATGNRFVTVAENFGDSWHVSQSVTRVTER